MDNKTQAALRNLFAEVQNLNELDAIVKAAQEAFQTAADSLQAKIRTAWEAEEAYIANLPDTDAGNAQAAAAGDGSRALQQAVYLLDKQCPEPFFGEDIDALLVQAIGKGN